MLPLPGPLSGASVRWSVVQAAPPAVLRRCPRCDRVQPFHSTGRFRVNGNGRKLDVWLIYACAQCPSTWNRDVHRRVAPSSLGAELARFERNDRELAAAVAAAPQFPAGTPLGASPFTLIAAPVEDASALIVDCPWGPGPRLDRVLAEGFAVSRAAVIEATAGGTLGVSRKQLRRPWRGEVRVELARGAW